MRTHLIFAVAVAQLLGCGSHSVGTSNVFEGQSELSTASKAESSKTPTSRLYDGAKTKSGKLVIDLLKNWSKPSTTDGDVAEVKEVVLKALVEVGFKGLRGLRPNDVGVRYDAYYGISMNAQQGVDPGFSLTIRPDGKVNVVSFSGGQETVAAFDAYAEAYGDYQQALRHPLRRALVLKTPPPSIEPIVAAFRSHLFPLNLDLDAFTVGGFKSFESNGEQVVYFGLTSRTRSDEFVTIYRMADSVRISTNKVDLIVDPEQSAQTVQVDSQNINTFGHRLVQGLVERNPGQNTAIGPQSVYYALGLTYFGAEGAARENLAQGLGLGEDGEAQLTAQFQRLKTRRSALDAASTSLAVTQRVYADHAGYFKESYEAAVRKAFGATSDTFTNDEAGASKINGWVAEQTEGNIRDLLTVDHIRDASSVLVNAFYFKGTWQERFKEYGPLDFTRADGSKKEATMMYLQTKFRYVKGSSIDAVALPYQDDFVMLAVKPKGSLTDYIRSLDAKALTDLIGQVQSRPANKASVYFPKTKIETTYEGLKNVLEAEFDLETAFGPDADYSRMKASRGSPVSVIIAKATLEIDEKGSKASQATAVIGSRGIGPMVDTLVFDSPYLVVIWDAKQETVVFEAAIFEP